MKTDAANAAALSEAPVAMSQLLRARKVADDLGAVLAAASSIQGWIDPAAGESLYRLARSHAPVPTVVELGAWKGRSTVWLASAIRDRGEGRVHTVDTWAGSDEEAHRRLLAGYVGGQLHEEFLANMRRFGLSDFITAWQMDTVQAARQWQTGDAIGLLFIDAGHDYAAVRRDFEMWSPFVCASGFIVFDDVPAFPGPTRVVSELPRWYRLFGTAAGQWIVQKV